MKTSEQINELAAALATVQGQMRPAQMNAVNPFLKNKYADLNSVIESVKVLLAENGLSYVQMPNTPPVEYGVAIGLTTRLMHTSGQWLEDTFVMPMPTEERGKSMMQVAGSAISYARRYALSAMLGIVADEDSDGNSHSDPRGRNVTKNPPKAKPALAANGRIADIRASLEELKAFTLGIVADRAAMTEHYENSHYALNAMKDFDFPDGVKVAMGQKVSKKGALELFDWLMERKQPLFEDEGPSIEDGDIDTVWPTTKA